MNRRVIKIAQPPLGNSSHAIRAGDFLFVAGVVGADYHTGTLAGVDHLEEAKQAFRNIQEILKADGLGLQHIVQLNISVTSLRFMADVNKLIGQLYTEGHYPTRDAVEVQMLPKNAKVQMSVIAYGPSRG